MSGRGPAPRGQGTGLTESALRNWVNEAKAREEPKPVEALTAAEQEELLRLRKENRQLQMERDFLKLLWLVVAPPVAGETGRAYPRASPRRTAVCYWVQTGPERVADSRVVMPSGQSRSGN